LGDVPVLRGADVFWPQHERYIAAANAHSRQKFFEVDPEIRSPTEAA
jgi:hypothetical protein